MFAARYRDARLNEAVPARRVGLPESEEVKMLYIAQHKKGYCLTRDKTERDNGHVETLCSYVIVFPTQLDEYTEGIELEDGLELCPECSKAVPAQRATRPNLSG